MKKKSLHLVAAGLLAPALIISGAVAQDGYRDDDDDTSWIERVKESPFSVELSTGIEYDSNVSVVEVDTSTAEGDFAALFDLGVGFETDIAENTTVEIGYDLGQDIQFDFTDFNTQTHRGSIEVAHDFGDVDIGVSYQLIHSRLGGDGFLTLHRLSPFASTYLADKTFYVRGSYIYTDKDFIGVADRDADVNAFNADVFYFVNGLTTYLIFGYKFESEDAVGAEFDFTANNLKARVVQRFPLGDRRAKFRAGWRYENRNYDSVTPSIGVVRDDTRHKLEASLEIPLNDIFYAEIEYNYDIFNSNLPSVDFTQSVATFRIGAEL